MPSTPYNRAGPGQPIPSYDDWTLQHRGTMAPWGVYEKDGQTASGFAWPAMVTEPVEAGKRFLSPGGGFENLPNQQSEQDALTLLMSLYGGNALSGTVKGAAATNALADMGRALSDTGRPSLLGSAIASGAEQGKPIRAYHGTRFASEPLHTYPVTDRMASAGDTKVRLWASSDADVASSYAEPIGNDLYWDEIYPRQTGHTPPPRAGGVFPVEMNFTNPLEVDAAGAGFQSVPWGGLIYPVDELAYVAQNMGHDGLIVKSLQDHMYDQNHAPSTVYAALKRGTVRSPLTGETLFSDTGRPNPLGSAIGSALDMSPEARLARAREQGFDTGRVVYHGSNSDITAFDPAMTSSRSSPYHRKVEQIHTTTDPADALQYGENTYPLYLRGVFKDTDAPPVLGKEVGDKLRDLAQRFEMGEGNIAPETYDRIQGVLYGIEQDPTYMGLSVQQSQMQKARRQGYSGIRVKGGWGWDENTPAEMANYFGGHEQDFDISGTLDHYVAFDPSNIRSVNAAFDPARAGENGLLLSDTGRPNAVGAAIASENARPLQGVHYTNRDFNQFKVTGERDPGYWGSGVYMFPQDYAARFADSPYGLSYGTIGDGSRNIPLNVNSQNPFVIDNLGPEATQANYASLADHGWPYDAAPVDVWSRDGITAKPKQVSKQFSDALNSAGYDSVVVRRDGNPYEMVAIKPGTVTGRYSGETLFSDTRPSLMGSALASEQGKDDWINYLLRP